ncbi:unnamed protein product [Zymoseptoria tritici ST99CH_1A5]|uniref:Uncharacterized protein n=2 Tax=Zymoseptoria tritici TaxID=1047171 RepID=F9XNS0_ZYMTI|nr:uncharacterized protein MYCGRDRAFT_97057 [Zymoseptoria tritici IPO323]EGP82921.1 hypothetical protein MYCGRDRAFT_97057 [Zymoseptoria tritici IPO323]SMR64087.1 unnamed protein product [Zymoseptoria tritici ST99CH_3D1]SMY29435.1 unnamed protein product [Zymoseptoria tritici ST99CH_1A5]
MGIIKALSRKLSGTRADSGVRSSERPSLPGDRNGLQGMNSRGQMQNGQMQNGQMQNSQMQTGMSNGHLAVQNGANQSTTTELVRPQYSTQPSTASSNQDYANLPSQLCDVVIHCATVLPRTNSNTSSVQSSGIPPGGQHIDFRNGGNQNGSFQGNNQRDTIMPLHSEQNGYQAGRLYKQPSVESSLHSSRPNTGNGHPDVYRGPCSCGGTPLGQDSRWDSSQDSYNNGNNNRHTMNVGQSHAGAFNNNNNNNQQNGWNQSGPPTDSSQSKQRNTYGMERGAYDEGYRDAMKSLQERLQ